MFLRPTDVDLSGPLCEFVRVSRTLTAAAPNLVGTLYEIPLGKVLIVQSLLALMVAGAAQWPLNARAFHFKEANIYVAVRETGKTAAYVLQYCMSLLEGPELWIPSGTLSYEGVFNAGVAANRMDVFITGWQIPKSSIIV